MQIHELTQRRKTQEGIGSMFGLDKPVVRQAWGAIGGELLNRNDAKNATKPAPASTAGTQQQTQPLATGVTVVSSSPVILKYKNKDYALTSNDTWVFLGSNKSPSAEMVAFLNKQLQSL